MNVFPGINQKKIGEYYSKFKVSFESEELFTEFVVNESEEQIINKLKAVIND